MIWFLIWPLVIVSITAYFVGRDKERDGFERTLNLVFAVLASSVVALLSNLVVAGLTSPVYEVERPVHISGKVFAIPSGDEWLLRAIGDNGRVYQSDDSDTRVVIHNSTDNTVAVQKAVPANRLWLINETADDIITFNIPTSSIVYR